MAEFPDVHFAGHLRSNRTNIWSDKSNAQKALGLELRTAAFKKGIQALSC